MPFDRPCAHEFVISSKGFGEKSALHIAKGLMDYGFHPPTIYFPLTEALMIEPTETESKETLDRFACALKKNSGGANREARLCWGNSSYDIHR